MLKPNLICKTFILVAALVFSLAATGQVDGDYQTRAGGNWNANTTWQVRTGGVWVDCVAGDYPGAAPGTGTVYITGNSTVSVTADITDTISSIVFTGASESNLVGFSGAYILNISGAITINPPTGGTNNNGIYVNSGIVTCNSLTSINSGNNAWDCKVAISDGTLTVNGNIVMGTTALQNDITFSGAGTLNVTGNLTTGQLTCAANSTINIGGTFTPTAFSANTSTVNYNGTDQNIGSYAYFNLTASNSGVKTLPNVNVTVNGNLNISNSTLAFTISTARTLTIAGDLSGDGTLDMSPGSRTHILNLGGASNTIGTFTTAAVASTVNYNRAGDQTVFASPAYRNLTISGSGNKTMQGDISVGGTLNPAGGSLSIGPNTLSLNGIINCGTVVGGATSNIIVGGAGAASFPGVTLNNLTISRAVTMCGSVTVGGTLTLTSGAFSIAANTLNLLNGASLSYGAGSLTGGVTSNLSFGTGADITLNAIANGLNDLNTSRNIILGADLSLNGTLTLTAGTFTVGPSTLTLDGPPIAGTPVNLATIATSGLSFGGSSAGVFIPGNVSDLTNLIINNENGVTMNSNISLASGGVLTLTSGILQAGTNILKITNTNPTTAIVWTPGSFVNVTSGSVERTLPANLTGTGNNFLFPIGEGGIFKGINLRDVNTGATGPVLSATVNATGALTGDGTTIGSVDPRYWSLANLNSGNLTSAKVELYESGLIFSKTVGMSSAVAGNYTAIGGSSNTSSVISPTVLNPGPYFSIGTRIFDTYYSYQSGDWNDPATWTSDPSGTLQFGNTIPGDNDKVIILTERTVSLPADIATQNLDITLDDGGILDQSIYRFTNSLYALRGQGTIKLASLNFPASVINTFINAGGGTTEYDNTADFILPAEQTTYNNLTINTTGFIATQLSNITLNGNLYVKSGTFQINNNISAVKLTLTINGNVSVDNGAFISVGNGVTNTAIGGVGGTAPFLTYYLNFHTVIIKGNFTNNGTVSFTNLAYPVYNAFPPTVAGPTSGAASVYFQGASDNTLECNGPTIFYNLILDKGIDQTFKLTINSTDHANFRLFGANVSATDGAVSGDSNLRKALWIRTGTLVLQGSLIIPSLSEGIAANSNYYIPSKAALVVDGLDVVVLSSADDYREINAAYTVTAPDNATIGVTMGGVSATYIFGKLQINNGYFSTRESGGLITSSIASGQLIINDGVVDSKQFLSSTGSASFTQTGGLFILRGRFQRTPAAYSIVADLTDVSVATLNTSRAANGINAAFGTFNLEQPAQIFAMSGGTIRIYDVCGVAAGEQKAFDVKSSASNISVTGGILEVIPVTGTVLADAGNYYINTNASLFDLIIDRASSASLVQLNTSPLIVLNDLTLASGDFSANNLDVTTGGDFSIADGTSYTPGSNTTVFNGTGDQTFTVNLATPLSLNNLTIEKPAGIALNFAGTQSIINVADNFRLITGSLNDNGNTINVAGNLLNSGAHSGTGRIALNGTLTQSIDGNGVFGNLELNNTNGAAAPVSLAANSTVNGTLTFSQDKLFNIGTYNLTLNAAASVVNSGPLRYVQSAGNAGDGGLTRAYASPAALSFPVGVVNYTPASISLSSAPTAYGSITVIPVNYSHPNVTASGRSITYFWRVKSSGFTLGTATVTHGYTYDQINVVEGGDVTEGEYVAARFDHSNYSWTKGIADDVDETSNIIGEPGTGSFLENVAFIDGDYTAGDDNPTSPFSIPTTYYSRQSGLWSNVNTWSLTSHIADNPPAVVPGASDIIIIGGQDSVYLATNNTVPNTDSRSCATLQIEAGSALDIGYNPASLFSIVESHPNGNGNFRVTTSWNSGSTFAFPSGDFSEFNVNLGTTELYSTNPTAGTTYWLPNGVFSYGNLILTPLGGSNIIFPNNDLTIYGNLITRGQNADSWFCPAWNTNYPTAPVVRVAKTITINGDLNIQGGALIWYGNGTISQDFVVNGNVIVATLSALYVWSGATSQKMSIGGSLINNTDGLSHGLTTTSKVDFTNIPVTFFGSTNAIISNTTGNPSTRFSTVTVNKGTSQATTLTCDIGGTLTTLVNNWLTLQNGTFRYMRTDPTTDFTISTTTPFTIPSTAGLIIDYANANNRSILIGNTSNTGDLILDGKLTLIRGNVYVGPAAAPAYNNDIEYSGSGASAIEIQGGNLVVNGQIRRNTSTTNGILNYTQSGGTVTINGNAANTGYAKLEVLNLGSSFNMSGGTLTIVRGGGTTYGDLYLRPDSSSVTGGTIIFTNVVPNTLQNYSLDANIPLNNLTVTGAAGAGLNAGLGLIVSPLVLNGTLTLSNLQSIFSSNNINVSIKGNLDNNGICNFGTNTTTFNGGVQLITGSQVTDFYNLYVLSTVSLTVNNNFSVNQDLFIGSGNLILGNMKVTLSGNLVNNGSYTDDNTSGGISLSGTTQQQITGAGAFGRLEINNSSGAKLNSNITLQNNLGLTQGILDINKFQLTLSQNSIIDGAPFDVTKMIKSDGVISNLGVRKFFTAAPQSFTFPVGVSGKYSPAIYTISASATVGYIKVNPINSYHPTVTDPSNVLHYYWQIESSGISGFDADVLFQYLPGDVYGVESDYVAAKLEQPSNFWYAAPYGPATDNVDETNHQITFLHTVSSNLNGDYTAGDNTAIPNEVHAYQSNNDGSWSDVTIWTPVGASPPCPSGGPNGASVIIDHVVTVDNNRISSFSTLINNRLRVLHPTYGHSLGVVSGNGTIYLESGNLPAGNYTGFTDCSGNGTIEYGGIGSYEITIVATLFNSLPNMVFTGTGTRVLPNKDLTICKRLVIDGPVLNNSVNNRKLIIHGSMERYNTGAFISGTGESPASTVSFAGTSVQTLGGPTGDFSGANGLNNLEINNPAGLNIGANGLVEVKNKLLLTNGIIGTGLTNKLTLLSTSTAAAIPSGGTAGSFISGPLIKQIINGGSFQYPIGQGTTRGHNFTLTATGGSQLFWTVEYFTPNPTATSLTPPLVVTNTMEYWSVSTTTVTTGKVKIGWDPTSDLTPLMIATGKAGMRVAEYIAGSWEEHQSTASGQNNDGQVETTRKINISTTPQDFTTASISLTRARASLSPSGPVCGAAGIPVSFTSFNPINLNYTLNYKINGVSQPTIDVTSLPYTLPTPVPGEYILTGFTYNNGAGIGVVDGITVNVYADPPVSDAGPDQSLCGVSGTLLAGNDPAPYSGLWTIVSGAGGTLIHSDLNSTVFTGALGETYILRWTISNVACTSSDEVEISFPVVAAAPSHFISAPATVCQSSSGNVYTVPNVIGNTYNWSYSGSGHTINGTGNSVTIDFNASATSGTLSVTATNDCGISAARTMDITVTVFPVATFSYAGTPYCQNAANPSPTFSGGGVAGTFSSTPGLVFVSSSTGEINLAASTPGSYIVTNTITASGGCSEVSATSPVSIISTLIWAGTMSTDWNDPGNWSCGLIPGPTMSVQISDVANKPVLSNGAAGSVINLTIESGSSLTVAGNIIQISGTIANSGIFDATDATVEMNGSAAQVIGADIFAGNTIKDLIINNPAGVSLTGPLNISGILTVTTGALASDGNLTLLSTSSQTALIAGSGSGNVTGDLTMQRYLPSGFGYKYFSSPFQAATVSEFGDDMDLTAPFTTFYRYDENRLVGGNPASGWVVHKDPSDLLSPLAGYTVNFGSSSLPNTVDVRGAVNNGSLSVTLYNHNNPYTLGFNLVGNPYPSPIDWDAPSGWIKTNIDDALYYFKASTTDNYGGTYSSYVNGVSGDPGVATNIIPSMQGFFIHISDGAYPVTGTLGVDNSVRITDLAHSFIKSDRKSSRPLIRLTAGFSGNPASTDPLVIYFDEKATSEFDGFLDALKLINTDLACANIYSVIPGGKKLSINSLPFVDENTYSIPVGVKLYLDGNLTFRISLAEELIPGTKVFLTDLVTGGEHDLLSGKEYTLFLPSGEHNSRFILNLTSTPSGIDEVPRQEGLFSIYSYREMLRGEFNITPGETGTLYIHNLTGNMLRTYRINDPGYQEFNPGLKDGLYVATFITAKRKESKKIMILNP